MKYLIHAPGLGHMGMEAAAALGAAVWLAIQSPRVKDMAVHQLNQVLLQPQAAGCHVLIASEDAQGGWTPCVWLAYAQMNAQFERDYMRNPSLPLPASAWQSGDRLWLLHLLAPNGFNPSLKKMLKDLFAGRSARHLNPDAYRVGQRVLISRGAGCSRTEAKHYWQERSILA